MRSTSRWMRAGIFVAVGVCLGANTARLAADPWSHDFEGAEAEAQRRGVPLLIHFHASYCGPCHQMESEFLNDPALVERVSMGLVAVKVDTQMRPDLARRFGVNTIPCDVIRDAYGQVQDRSVGYQDRQSYLAMVARNSVLTSRRHSVRIATQLPRINPSVSDVGPPLRLTPPPVAPSPVKPSPPPVVVISPTSPAPSPSRPRGRPFLQRLPLTVGLRGYSPVALTGRRMWIRGDQRLAWNYKGIVYYMVSAEELRMFRENPDRYAPQVLGCDPVILDVADRAVSGDIRFAAFFDGALYLFVSEKSRQTFKQDPDRFVRIKHVLNADELSDQRLE